MAAATVPEYSTSSPRFAPSLTPETTMSNSKSNRPVIARCTQSVGVPLITYQVSVVHALHAQRHLERQRMARAAEVAVGRDDRERRDALERLRAESAAPRRDSRRRWRAGSSRSGIPSRSRVDATGAHYTVSAPSRRMDGDCRHQGRGSRAVSCRRARREARSSSRSGRPSASAAVRAPPRAARTRPVCSPIRSAFDAHDLDVESGDELGFRRDGVPESVLRRLRRGEYAIRDEIDLHGMTQDEARRGARRFPGRGDRCTGVIASASSTERDAAPAIAGRCSSRPSIAGCAGMARSRAFCSARRSGRRDRRALRAARPELSLLRAPARARRGARAGRSSRTRRAGARTRVPARRPRAGAGSRPAAAPARAARRACRPRREVPGSARRRQAPLPRRARPRRRAARHPRRTAARSARRRPRCSRRCSPSSGFSAVKIDWLPARFTTSPGSRRFQLLAATRAASTALNASERADDSRKARGSRPRGSRPLSSHCRTRPRFAPSLPKRCSTEVVRHAGGNHAGRRVRRSRARRPAGRARGCGSGCPRARRAAACANAGVRQAHGSRRRNTRGTKPCRGTPARRTTGAPPRGGPSVPRSRCPRRACRLAPPASATTKSVLAPIFSTSSSRCASPPSGAKPRRSSTWKSASSTRSAPDTGVSPQARGGSRAMLAPGIRRRRVSRHARPATARRRAPRGPRRGPSAPSPSAVVALRFTRSRAIPRSAAMVVQITSRCDADARRLGDQREVAVLDRESTPGHARRDLAQERAAVGTGMARVPRREMQADVAERRGAQQRVHEGVQEHVSVRVSDDALRVRHRDAAEPDRMAGPETVHVVTEADSHRAPPAACAARPRRMRGRRAGSL